MLHIELNHARVPPAKAKMCRKAPFLRTCKDYRHTNRQSYFRDMCYRKMSDLLCHNSIRAITKQYTTYIHTYIHTSKDHARRLPMNILQRRLRTICLVHNSFSRQGLHYHWWWIHRQNLILPLVARRKGERHMHHVASCDLHAMNGLKGK